MNAHAQFEDQVASYRSAGMKRDEIAAVLGCSVYRVRCIIDPSIKLRRRGRDEDPPTDRDWLALASKPAVLMVEDVKRAACEHFQISSAALCARRRDAATVYRRHVAIYVACQDTTKSSPHIGRSFGGLDHTTVLHARGKISAALAAGNKLITADVEAIRARLKAGRAAA